MSISEHEQQVLESIENDLASAGPKLASMLAIFARLTAGEEMPVREPIRRAVSAPPARVRADAVTRGAGPRRIRPQRAGRPVWMLWFAVAVAIALITLAMTAAGGAGPGACQASRAAACRHAPATPESGVLAPSGL